MRLKALCAFLAIGCMGVACSSQALAKKTTLVVWHALYGGWSKDFFDEAKKQFEKQNPGVTVQMVGVDVGGEKFLTAAAAGSAPDVIFPDGPQVVQWGYRNLLLPLDRYMKSSKMSTDLFWAPAFKHGVWKGQTYALPWIADSNFSLVCSKSVFNEAGLAKPPESLDELELYAKKINKVDDKGNYSRLGYVPLPASFADANSLFTHGWMFGGSFYDDKNHRVTLNDPKIVSAMGWLSDYVNKAGQAKYSGFVEKYASWGKPEPIAAGRVGMGYRLSAFLDDVVKMKKTYSDFMYGFLNGPENGGEKKTAWTGGWDAAIPANAKNKDLAWKYIKFVCYDAQGTSLTYNLTHFLPGVKNAECFKNPDPAIKPFLEVLAAATHYRPVTPVTPVLWKEMERVMPLVVKGKKTPKQALDEATAVTQKELDRILKRK